jgi:hypothetical protein
MTTREFIEKTYNIESDRERHCSSVFTDNKGIVYSYGYHYPLAFHVKGLDFVNNAGYSNTTAKHIGWAQGAIGYGNYINVKLWREESRVISASYSTEDAKLEAIHKALLREHASIIKEMDSKKRKDTQVYRQLEHDFERVTQYILKVRKA